MHIVSGGSRRDGKADYGILGSVVEQKEKKKILLHPFPPPPPESLVNGILWKVGEGGVCIKYRRASLAAPVNHNILFFSNVLNSIDLTD